MYYSPKQETALNPYLQDNVTWGKLTDTDPNHGFQNDTGAGGKSKVDKASDLNLMLHYIMQWIPHYLANDVEKQLTSFKSVWHIIRKYYIFQQYEAQFMKHYIN